jgi:hypothetical protein
VGRAALERPAVKIAAMFLLLGTAVVFAQPVPDRPTVLVVVGSAGETIFEPMLSLQAEQWTKAAEAARARLIVLGLTENPQGATDRDRLQESLAAEAQAAGAELWLVLIGHGTFDGKEAKFNLRGPDVTASELALWLKPTQRPVAVINTTSGSAPFLSKLSGPNRVLVTATRSGNELNLTRFGRFFAETFTDPKSDFDQDGQTSVLEAFLSAAARTGEFYKTEGRLATEHALIDDNGDGFGTPADWFRGTRATKKSRDGASLDGMRARQFHLIRSEAEQKLTPEQRARRDELELTIEKLRESKVKLGDENYYRQLETLLLELARVYQPAPASGT